MIPVGGYKNCTFWVTYKFSIHALSFNALQRYVTCVYHFLIWNGVNKSSVRSGDVCGGSNISFWLRLLLPELLVGDEGRLTAVATLANVSTLSFLFMVCDSSRYVPSSLHIS